MTASFEWAPRLAATPCAPKAVVNPTAYSGHIVRAGADREGRAGAGCVTPVKVAGAANDEGGPELSPGPPSLPPFPLFPRQCWTDGLSRR